MNGSDTLEARHRAVQVRLEAACHAAGRDPATVRLLAVSKTFPADAIRALHGFGPCAFGENYLQEAQQKIAALADVPALEWHFIGPIQSNKTGPIARHFDWVHSIERASIAERLSRQRLEAGLAPLSVCIQINVSGEASKSGCAPAEAPALGRAIRALAGLQLRGVMAIPEPTDDDALLRSRFREAANVLQRLREDAARDEAAGHALGAAIGQADKSASGARAAVTGATTPLLDTLSMGMSADLETAIAEGATLVRVGSALFGARAPTT